MIELSPRVRWARAAGFAAWAALLALQLVWHAWLAPPAHTSISVALGIAMLPLLLPLLAMREPARALLLAGMVALFYFCHGVSEAWSHPHLRGLASAEIFFSLALIAALGASVQKRKR